MNLQPLIQQVTEQNLQLRRLVVRQHGEIIAEHSFPGDLPDQLWSASKTFTSLAIGLAQGEGYFNVHDKLHTYIPAANQPGFDQLTIHDLLCMGTGQAEDPFNKYRAAGLPLDNIEEIFLSEPIRHEPGSYFIYSNCATYMLSNLITRTTEQNLLEYLTPRLFEPLHIQNVTWIANKNGISFGCAGINMDVHDLSKVGQLLLNTGQWQGNQLIPAEYISEATRKQINSNTPSEHFTTPDHLQGYGYQLWMNHIPNTYRFDGKLAQYVVILPDQDAVVTMVSNEPERMSDILELTWNFLIEQL